MAHNATDVLASARCVRDAAEALADCRWIAGTTRRTGRRRTPTLEARELAQAVQAAPERRPLAIVFGPEAGGLEMSELGLCHDTVRIPTDAAQPSLNLSQAVLVIAYELFVAGLDAIAARPARPARVEAEAALLEPLYAHLEHMLLAVGFVRADTAPHRMLALRHILGRARLGPGDVRLLRGICRQVLWATAERSPAARRGAERTGNAAPRPQRPAGPRARGAV
jgi:tRNA/rRNA methyltransferase